MNQNHKLKTVFSKIQIIPESRQVCLFIAACIIFFTTISIFYPVIFFDRVFFFGDTLTQRLPSMVFWKQQVTTGQLPLWNPYIFAGIPHLADLSTNTLSPFNLAYLFIPNPLVALSYLVVFVTAISAIFTFLYLKFHFAIIPSLFGSLVFAFSGTTLAAANDINSLQGIIFIPILLWSSEKLIRHFSLRHLILLSFILCLQFISGHPQYSYYTWIFLAFYLSIFLPQPPKFRLRIITLIFFLFLGLSSIQLLPFLELSSQTYRPHQTEFAAQNSLSLVDLPRFFLANIYGNWISGTSWGPDSPLEVGRATTEGYLGILPIFLSLTALFKLKSPLIRFFALVAVLTLVLSFGPSTPLYRLLHQYLPLFNNFRSPVRILSLYTLSVSFLSSAGLHHLSTRKHAQS